MVDDNNDNNDNGNDENKTVVENTSNDISVKKDTPAKVDTFAKEYRNSKKRTNEIIDIIKKFSDVETKDEDLDELLKNFKTSLLKNDNLYNMGAYGSTKGVTAVVQLIANLIAKLLGRSPKEHNHFNKKINESLKTIIDELKLEVKDNVEFTIPDNLKSSDKKKVLDRLIDLYEVSVQVAEHQGAKIDVNEAHKVVVAYIEANSKNDAKITLEEELGKLSEDTNKTLNDSIEKAEINLIMFKENLKVAQEDRNQFNTDNEEIINNFESNIVKNDLQKLSEILENYKKNKDYKYDNEVNFISKVISNQYYNINQDELNTKIDSERIKYIYDKVNEMYKPILEKYNKIHETLIEKNKEIRNLEINISKLETQIIELKNNIDKKTENNFKTLPNPLSGISAIVNKQPNELLKNTPVENLTDLITLKSRMANYKHNNKESVFSHKVEGKSVNPKVALEKIADIFNTIAYADQKDIPRSVIEGNKKFAEEFLESTVKIALDSKDVKDVKDNSDITSTSILITTSSEVLDKINRPGTDNMDKKVSKEAMSQVLNILTNQLSNHGCKNVGKDGNIEVKVSENPKKKDDKTLETSAIELFKTINKIKSNLGIEASISR